MYPASDLPGTEQCLQDFLIGRVRRAADLHRAKRPSQPPRGLAWMIADINLLSIDVLDMDF
jgi:hypothetical protein